MSSSVLEFQGMFPDPRDGQPKPAFKKKDGGTWYLNPGNVNWAQFQPGKLYVTWDNFTAQSATTQIPERTGGGKGGFQKYHPETFVSNVVGQAIQAGKIQSPTDINAWAQAAWSTITALGK